MDFPKWYSIERVCTLRLRLVCGLFLLVVFMMAVVASEAGAQVRIRERVEITPSNTVSPAGGDGVAISCENLPPFWPPLIESGPPYTERVSICYGDSAVLWPCYGCQPTLVAGNVEQGAEYMHLELRGGEPGIGGHVDGTEFHYRQTWGYSVAIIFDGTVPTECVVVRVHQVLLWLFEEDVYLEFTVIPPRIDSIKAQLPLSVQHRSAVDVSVIPFGQCPTGPAYTYGATVLSGTQYGRLVHPLTGDTVISATGIPFSKQIRFAAIGVNPDTAVRVPLRFTPSDQSVPVRDTAIYVLPSLPDTIVQFVRPASSSVYPSYRGRNNATTKRNYIDLELKITTDGQPVSNCLVQVLRPELVDSGGHSHGGNRPLGRFNHPTSSTDTAHTTDTLLVQTDSTGTGKFRYVASQFGGVERIKVRIATDTTKFDTLSLATQVPGLDVLPTGTHYVKVGGTCLHHGPSDDSNVPEACMTPDTDHWGTSRLLTAIPKIAAAYDSLHPGIRLRINDLSLPYGGLFDYFINSPWQTPHSEHRIGINADLGYQGLNSQNERVDIDTTDIQKIIYMKTETPALHHRPGGPVAPHFHIYVKKD